ncbi:MAG: peptidase domain-containing ABC transporter [Legionellaceae bacterium]|nr:peptidase domain-containing ABC transporter [Legionellaceae bacterium]
MKTQSSTLRFSRTQILPMILQDEIAECGHACVAMISQFFGHTLDLYGLRKISKPSTHGVNLRHINNLLVQLGFKTRALRVPIHEVRFIKTPAILHWNMNHFVILKQIKKNKIILHDPAIGIRSCSFDEFSQSFTGIVLEVEKADDFQLIRSQNKLSLYDIIKTVPRFTHLFSLLILLSLSIELLTLLNPLFIQYVTDNVITSSNLGNLYTIASGFTLFVFVHTLAEYTREHLVLYTTTHCTESFSSNVFKHLLTLPTSFFETRHQGDLQSKFQSIEQIQTKISTDFINTLLDGLMFIVNLLVMLVYSRILSSIVIVTLLLYVTIRYVSYQSLKNQTASSVYLHAKVATTFLETLRAITPIKLFLKENGRFSMWRNGYVDALNSDIQISKQQIRYRVANHFIFNIELIIVICVGAQLVLTKQFSIGMLISFLAYRLMLVNKASSFIRNIFDYQLISVQLNRLSDILFHESERTHTEIDHTKQSKGSLSLQDISFQYNPNDSKILNKITINIHPGEKVAIIGASGCGKSTLLKVMMGLLPPSSGDIYVDNTPLHVFGLNNYRTITAAVMQHDSLLTGSIIDNITFFEEQIDWDHAYHVAKLARIHDMIMTLPMGYETLISDMGSALSGGQKQRLLLARALYKRPNILFLDEATSHLDDDNEKYINQALKSLNITQIIVAHRKETIKMADRVIDLMTYT